jgi:2-polyprenyl-6-hydroxyphenyl methylase/3-demethylubiquinone-9 3-methyltransferase
LAKDWWDPKGASAMLHRMNPARLRHVRERIDEQWNLDEHDFAPLAGKRALDVGCGAGLLAEPLARLGAAVTGIDAAGEVIGVARAHAEALGLSIDYRVGGVEMAEPDAYDLVTAMEVVEHAADPRAFVAGLAAALVPGGLLILSTPNRTALSRLAMIAVGEGAGLIPKGTHDWSRFLRPEELTVLCEAEGLAVRDISGLTFSPARGFAIGARTSLDYFLTATRRE